MEVGFEKWLSTEQGKGCLNISNLKTEEFLKNRLWWAFYAGHMADDIHLTSDVQQILEDIYRLPQNRVPILLKKRIKYILDHKEDYSIEKL